MLSQTRPSPTHFTSIPQPASLLIMVSQVFPVPVSYACNNDQCSCGQSCSCGDKCNCGKPKQSDVKGCGSDHCTCNDCQCKPGECTC
ncbi:hypothetical protein DFP72DRAFT_917891 [Ephemerocybe angulata]|uniref:Metallothionein n=1 Tax=Ephemerocybe angulata TaxID=980116 RepID=A0A8H6HJR3_9AGAR|nr:hypothetical protein DFP72DRAFT_917891 [Tulosesus angulatus]